ncbi:conserved hypothetical protein (putative transposase or invertase) [bacterium A37T11]|nr:conserved hypothetical protein (putative transposase or invertase) [bacterium A37T11]
MGNLVRFDWAIKRLLRNKANFVILEGFLSELLKEDIKIQEVLESESNKDTPTGKQNRVDILVKNTKGEYIIIEIQQNSEFDYFQRMLYATSSIVKQDIDQGERYGVIKRIISINILYFDLGHGDDYVYKGGTIFRGLHNGQQLELTQKQKELYKVEETNNIFPEYYIIKVNNFDDVAKDTLDEWIYFLKNSEVKDEFSAKGIQKAKEELNILKLSDQERREFEQFLHYWRISESEYETAYITGEDNGIIKGKEIGREEGKVEKTSSIVLKSYQKGLTVDDVLDIAEVTLHQIAQILLKAGEPLQKVAAYTGLNPEEIG